MFQIAHLLSAQVIANSQMERTCNLVKAGRKYCSKAIDMSLHLCCTHRISENSFQQSCPPQVLITHINTRRYEPLTKRLVDLFENLLLECLILDKASNIFKTLIDLVRWKSSHQVEDGLGHHTLRVLVLCSAHHFRY